MAWNMSGLTIILFFVNESIAILLSDSNASIILESVSPQTGRVLSSAKVCIEAVSVKVKKIIDGKVEQTRFEHRTLRYTGNNFVIVAISIIYL